MPDPDNNAVEFVVWGTPKSQQAKGWSKKNWQNAVGEAIPPPAEFLRGGLRARIDFYFEGSTELDIDNIIKPILDAMNDIVYDDDKRVVEVTARRFSRATTVTGTPPAELIQALTDDSSGDFVFIRVDSAPTEAIYT